MLFSHSYVNCSVGVSMIIYVSPFYHLDFNKGSCHTWYCSSPSQDDVPTLVSMEEITSLESGQTMTRILQARFHHHLLPLKLALYCNGKRLTVRLRPDIGYFIRAVPMDVETFIYKESQLPGMFEYKRRSVTNFIVHIDDFFSHKHLQKTPLSTCKCTQEYT